MSGEPSRLLPETEYLLDRDRAAYGTALTALRGGDPLRDPPAFGYPENMQVEIERQLYLRGDQNRKLGEVFRSPESGWGTVQQFMDKVFETYRTQNEAALLKKPKTEEEALTLAQQMQPVRVDPNEVANIRQIVAKQLIPALKAADPGFDPFTDPRTKDYMAWINREAGVGEAGFMASGEQQVDLGGWGLGRAAQVVTAGAEGVMAVGTNIGHGLWDLARRSVTAMGGPDIGTSYPDNWIDQNGERIYNAGKVPSAMDGLGMMWDYALGNNIMQNAADHGRAREWEEANRAGLAGLLTSVSKQGGELMGMGPIFGAFGKAGQMIGPLSVKGLQALGMLRLAKPLTQNTDRALKIISAMNNGLGKAAGWAAYESVNRGRIEGYGESYLHGLMMAPVLMAIGAMGSKSEWFLNHRTKMPGFTTRAIAGALEGAGFAGVETIFPEVLPSSWGFLQNPNEGTWETFSRNMLAFMLVKMGTGRTFNADPAVVAFVRGVDRAKMAEEIARGRVTPEAAAKLPIKDTAKLQRLGQLSIEAREGATPEARQRALEEQRALEAELDREEFGKKGPAAKVPEQAAEILESAKQPPTTVHVEGKEPRRLEPVEDKPVPLEQMAQEGGREGLEAERLKSENVEEIVRGVERRIAGTRDPLEDPRFGELPEALRNELIAEKDVGERKRIFSGYAAERRVSGERRGNVPRDTISEGEAEIGVAEVRRGQGVSPTGIRAGPGSFQQPPTRQVEPTPGVQPVGAHEIIEAMKGRPARGGIRIPLMGKRIGGTEGDPVRLEMRGGHIKGGRGVQGVFEMFRNLARSREGRDLVTSTHEWAHAMHRHMISQRGGREFVRAAREQLQAVLQRPDALAIRSEMDAMLADYPGAQQLPRWLQWMETWAEWHARNLLGEVGLDQKFPALSQFMRGWLAAPAQARLRDQYGRIQDMLFRYNAQGSLQRTKEIVVRGPEIEAQRAAAKGNPVVRLFRYVNKILLDDMADLKLSQEKWLQAVGRRPEDVSLLDDPARLFDTLRMTVDKTVDHFVNHGIRIPGGEMVPGLKSIFDSVGKESMPDFQHFVVAVRQLALYAGEKTIPLTLTDWTETVKQLQAKHPEFPERMRELKRWTDALVDWVVRAGGLAPDDAQKIKEKYVVYVPSFRALEGPKQHGQGRGVAERGTGMGRIEGSTLEIVDPLVKLQDVARSMVAKAHQNQVVEALYKMSMGQEAGGLAAPIRRSLVPHNHPLAKVMEAIEKGLELPEGMDPDAVTTVNEAFEIIRSLKKAGALNEQTVTLFMQKVIPTGEPNVIAFTPRLSAETIDRLVGLGANRGELEAQNHKLQWLELDTQVYESLMGIDKMPQLPASLQPIFNFMQAPRDFVRFFATGVAPGFVAANMIRDALTAPLFDRNGDFRPFGGFVSLFRGAIEYHKGGAMRELYEELGAKASSFWTEGRQRALVGEQMTLWQKAKHWANLTQEWFAHPENYIRMDRFKAAYDAAKSGGKSEMEARMEALEAGREATVNFARAGIVARAMNMMVPYFNAGVQGQRKFWGQLIAGGADTKGDAAKARVQRGTILNGIANITVPSLVIWAMFKDEEWYQDLPDWRKNGYFNFKIGDGPIISIPKPFEAGMVFGAVPQIYADMMFGENHASMGSAVRSMAGPFLDGWNAVIPAIVKPMIEVGWNYNAFTKRELTPEWIERSQPREKQATFYTTETAKVMSKALGGWLTPIEIEHLLAGYTAGATTLGLKVFDEVAGLKTNPGIQRNIVMETAKVLNPVGRFFKQQPHGQSDFVDQLYELGVDLEQREDTLTSSEKSLKHRVEEAKKSISALRKQGQAGKLSRAEAELRAYKIARPIIEKQR